jgi:tRNA A-37 threonylcarbamoyl transferase component Bud32
MDRSPARAPEDRGTWLIHGGKKSDVIGVRISETEAYAVKYIHDDRMVAAVRTALGRGKGRRAFEIGLQLEEMKVHAPRVYGYVEKKPFGAAILIMEWLEGYEKLQNILRDEMVPDVELAQYAMALGKYVACIHEKGVYHDDFSSRNLLVNPDDISQGPAIVDFEDITFPESPLSEKNRTNQLAEMRRSIAHLPQQAGECFLKSYLDESGMDRSVSEFRAAIRAIAGNNL